MESQWLILEPQKPCKTSRCDQFGREFVRKGFKGICQTTGSMCYRKWIRALVNQKLSRPSTRRSAQSSAQSSCCCWFWDFDETIKLMELGIYLQKLIHKFLQIFRLKHGSGWIQFMKLWYDELWWPVEMCRYRCLSVPQLAIAQPIIPYRKSCCFAFGRVLLVSFISCSINVNPLTWTSTPFLSAKTPIILFDSIRIGSLVEETKRVSVKKLYVELRSAVGVREGFRGVANTKIVICVNAWSGIFSDIFLVKSSKSQ